MTVMALLLIVILFLAFFIYFSGLNPHEITLFYLPDQQVTFPAAIIVVACILLGLVLGYIVHLYGATSHWARNRKRIRTEKKTREVSTLYREGIDRLMSGDQKKARSLLQKTLEKDPSRMEAYIALASLHEQEGRHQESINLLLQARKREPANLEILFKLASVYESAGRDEEATQIYGDILSIESGNRKALRALRDLGLRNSQWLEAHELQKRILKADSGGEREPEEKRLALYLRYETAREMFEAGETDKALSEFRDIAKEARDFAPVRVSLGDVHRRQNRNEEAAQVWKEGYNDLGKSIFLSRLEDLYLNEEDPATLLSFFRSTLAEKRDDLLLRLYFARLCLRLEMVDEALEQLAEIESTGADFPQLHLLQAEAHRRRNRMDESIEEYKKVLGIDAQLRFKYACEGCGETSIEWRSRCPSCGTWGSFSLAGRQQIKGAPPAEIREIFHGERKAWEEE